MPYTTSFSIREKTAGYPIAMPSLRLNTFIKGLRRGELTIVSGGTGPGKTSLSVSGNGADAAMQAFMTPFLTQIPIGQYSLAFARDGVPTLWGSFEINNARLLGRMMAQMSEGPVTEATFPDALNH